MAQLEGQGETYHGAGADRREGDVASATAHLAEMAEQLLDSTASLASRLSVILRPTDPEPGRPEPPEVKAVDPLRSPLGARLWSIVENLNEANRRLRAMEEQAEV